MVMHATENLQPTQERIDVRVVSDGTGRPREMSVLPDDLGRIVADYAARSHVIEVVATISGERVSTRGPRYREHASACRRAQIIETAKQHRTGGLALMVALTDTPHQQAFAAELGKALFPTGEEVRV